MSTETKLYGTALGVVISGILVSLHVVDPSQQETLNGLVQTIFGALLSLGAAFYALEGLLAKHKAEVAQTVPPTTQSQTQPSSSASAPSEQVATPTAQ